MYFLKVKRVLSILILLIPFYIVSGQEKMVIPDTLVIPDTTLTDTTVMKTFTVVSADAIDATVSYKAAGYKKNDLVNRKVYLIDGA
ncbi:MAG TPA: hypothetical protein VK861_09495, partial [Bacteroidales bacterium]|nr:hypothetical protein [Bacteroidales bacterium]